MCQPVLVSSVLRGSGSGLCTPNSYHILPFYLAKGIAYGFLYRDESDIASIEITNYVKEHGIEKAIEVYCGLTENEWELKQLIMAQYKEAEKIR